MEKPRTALDAAGAETVLIAPKGGTIKGFDHLDPNDDFDVDVVLKDADPEDYDGLLLPGGVANPDALRLLPEAVQFAQAFFKAGKPVAAICHGPQLLIEAGVVRGRKLTSFPRSRPTC